MNQFFVYHKNVQTNNATQITRRFSTSEKAYGFMTNYARGLMRNNPGSYIGGVKGVVDGMGVFNNRIQHVVWIERLSMEGLPTI